MSNYQCMCEVCNGKKSNFLYGFDVDGMVNERIAEEQNRIMADIIEEFEKSSIYNEAIWTIKIRKQNN